MSKTVIEKVVRRFIEDEHGNRRDYYVGALRNDHAKMITFVPVAENSTRTFLEENTADGYQRPGSAARMSLFAKYAEEHPLAVVPPVVLSGRGRWSFVSEKNSDFGRLEVEEPAAIIDGQHRMGGYVKLWDKSKMRREVDFVLLPNLVLEEEKQEFLAINNTQKGVERSLTTLLLESDEALVGVEMDEREDSPFKGRIQQVKKQRQHIFSLAAVAKNVGRTFSHGGFDDTPVDVKADIMIKYWELIGEAFPEEWDDLSKPTPKLFQFKLLETTGLIAWSYAATDVLAPSYDPSMQSVNWGSVRARLQTVADRDFDWSKSGEFSNATGEVGGKLIHKAIQKALVNSKD
ncbi:DGQHR domain-containing protein [Knoellia sp. CPCC 206435]|uniref:DGQHR domain-containing protein n=1 Tax=Knoellia terrae TaxID=3404797 RepID=UPI003B435659